MYTFTAFSTILVAYIYCVKAYHLNATTTTQEPLHLSSCPCLGQPEGIVIPHPSDCRAYYTCLGGENVLQSRCDQLDKFFHPYIRSCVQRSAIASFIPDFIPTKDICKITAVFPAPAMEDFGNCVIKLDETSLNDPNSDEIPALPITNTNDHVTSKIPGLDSILGLFPWASNRSEIIKTTADMSGSTTETSQASPQTLPFPTTTTTPSSSAETPEACKLVKVLVHHFPGPCKAEITCESGATLTIDNCKSSLNLV